ncbi:MAG: UDP-N-acetylglucosamine 2-epimerase (non-hydrolyzing) [Nitrospira sp.]|nr:UDP-N-acetylglucosamine 2-epimerase (non-hydrolyzing) [Nitrospira sp.]
MKLLLIAGARPNFMKIASIVEALDAHNQRENTPSRRLDYLVIHTGQHYDEKMSGTFFKELGLPKPAVDLEVGSAPHAVQTAEIMKRFEPVLEKERPDAVIVVGDVNSTAACALVAAKITYGGTGGAATRSRPLIAHVEAGLRSRDRSMPEEINRIVTDSIADVLFVTEADAARNLIREGVPRRHIHFVGNTMVDTLLRHRTRAERSPVLERLGLLELAASPRRSRRSASGDLAVRPYGVVTLHRPGNVDDPIVFRGILDALLTVGRTLPLIFPAHPRTFAHITKFGLAAECPLLGAGEPIKDPRSGLYCIEPLGYLDFLRLMSRARIVLTDSGGIQEETTVLGVPCVTLRKNTERPVTISHGTNILAGTDTAAIIRKTRRQLAHSHNPTRPRYWDGKAGRRIVKILKNVLADSSPRAFRS